MNAPTIRFSRARARRSRRRRRGHTLDSPWLRAALREPSLEHLCRRRRIPARGCRPRTPEPVRAARPAPLRAVLLDPVPRRRQRQPVQVRVHRDGDVPADAERPLPAAAARRPDHRRALHPAVPAVLRHQRPADRQVRQDARHPLRQEPRDRDHAARGVGLLDRQSLRPARLRLPDGPALDAVRPGQVRLPAAAPGRARAHRRQRHGRDGNLRRDPARPGRGRPARRHPRRRPPLRRLRLRRRRAPRPDRRPVRADVAFDRPGPAYQLESGHRDLAEPEARARQPGRLPLAPRHLVDVVLRRRVPGRVPVVRQGGAARRRAGRVAAPGGVLGRHRHRLAAVRDAVAAPRRDRPGAARRDRHERVRDRPLLRLARPRRHRPATRCRRSWPSRRTGT